MNTTNSHQTTTLCRICEAQCGLKVTVDANRQRVLEVKADDEHVVSKGYACIKGLSFEDFRTSGDRLTQPLKRISAKHEKPQFEAISWEQALREIGRKVRKIRRDHGDDSTGLYFGNPIAFSLLYPMFINGFVRGLNTSKFFNTGTLDCNNKFVVAEQMYGSAFALTYPNVDRNQFLMILGGNPAVSKMSFINLPHPMKRIKAITERGGRVVHVNPRRTESAAQAGEHLFIRPDTDVFFLLSFLREILHRDQQDTTEQPFALDHPRIKRHMTGFEHLAAVSEQWTPEVTAEITRIPAATLRELVTAYLDADGAALYLSTGVNQGTNGVLAYWIQEVINAISGNLDSLAGVQMGEGIIDYAGLVAKNTPQTHTSRIGNTPSFLEALPCALMADEILTPGRGQMKALFVISGNPLLSATRSERFGEALQQLELLVSLENVQNETADYADYILPGSHFAERADVPFLFGSLCGTTPVPWYQYVDPLVSSPGEAKDEIWTLHQLAKHCDAPLFGSRLFQASVSLGEYYGKLPLIGKYLTPLPNRLLDLLSRAGKQGSIKKLRKYPHGKLRKALQEHNYLGKRVVTPDGKVQLAPAALITMAHERLEHSFALRRQEQDTLKLITKRERFSHNTWTHNHAKFIKHERHSNYLYMHPEDAARIAASSGDRVQVSSGAGNVIVPLRIDDNMMPGSVALPHGWGHSGSEGQTVAKTTSGVNANILASDGPDSVEPLSGMTQFNGINVDVVRVS
jgi:anaerobic selenocysteine-containing dehydrogenase